MFLFHSGGEIFSMFFSVFLSFSLSETISKEGFNVKQLSGDESLNLNLDNSSLSSIFLWKENQKLSLKTTLFNGTNFKTEFQLEDAPGLKIQANTAEISFNQTSELVIWTIPSSICNGPIIYYSSQHYIQDDVILEKGVDLENDICAFFSNKDEGMDLYAKVNAKSDTLKPNIDIYGVKDDGSIGSLGKCNNAICTSTISAPFFLRMTNMITGASYSIDAKFNKKDTTLPANTCSQKFLIQLINDQELIYTLLSKSQDLICEPHSSYYRNVEHFYIVLAICVIVFAVIIFCYITGLYQKISYKLCCCLNKAGEPNNDGITEDLVNENVEHFDIQPDDEL